MLTTFHVRAGAVDMLVFGAAATPSRLAAEPAVRRAGMSFITPKKYSSGTNNHYLSPCVVC